MQSLDSEAFVPFGASSILFGSTAARRSARFAVAVDVLIAVAGSGEHGP